MQRSVRGFLEISEDMVHILLMLEILFTQNSKVEGLFCGVPFGSKSSLFFCFKAIQDDFHHDFA